MHTFIASVCATSPSFPCAVCYITILSECVLSFMYMLHRPSFHCCVMHTQVMWQPCSSESFPTPDLTSRPTKVAEPPQPQGNTMYCALLPPLLLPTAGRGSWMAVGVAILTNPVTPDSALDWSATQKIDTQLPLLHAARNFVWFSKPARILIIIIVGVLPISKSLRQ